MSENKEEKKEPSINERIESIEERLLIMESVIQEILPPDARLIEGKLYYPAGRR